MAVILSNNAVAGINQALEKAISPGVLVEKEITNAIILFTDKAVAIIDPINGFVKGSDYLLRDWPSMIRQGSFSSAKYLKGTHIAGFNAAKNDNYYHWVYQAFLSAFHFERKWPDQEFASILVSSDNSFRKAYLQKLRSPYTVMDKENVYIVEKLLWSNLSSNDFVFHKRPDSIELLRNLAPSSEGKKRIYISRGDTLRRRVINETECIGALEELGFIIQKLSHLSVDEQIALFSDAAIVVGPHGAGLTNMSFAKPGTKVVELFQDNYQNGCFRAIAESANLNYTMMINETISSGLGYHFDSMSVDIPLLVTIIKNLLEGS